MSREYYGYQAVTATPNRHSGMISILSALPPALPVLEDGRPPTKHIHAFLHEGFWWNSVIIGGTRYCLRKLGSVGQPLTL